MVTQTVPQSGRRRVLRIWTPEDKAFWEKEGEAIARLNLWISVPCLFLAFAIWQLWSVAAVNLPALGFKLTTNQLFWLAALPALSFAQGLPQLENPTRGTGNGIMETIRNYGYDIIMLVALLVVASMFIGVCYHAYGTYAEIHTGRKTWGQFGLTVAIGAVLLVIGIWLLTEATGIL